MDVLVGLDVGTTSTKAVTAFYADLCDRVTVMQSGLFVETGPVRAIFQRPEHPYTKSLLASILDEGPARPPLAFAGTAPQGGVA